MQLFHANQRIRIWICHLTEIEFETDRMDAWPARADRWLDVWVSTKLLCLVQDCCVDGSAQFRKYRLSLVVSFHRGYDVESGELRMIPYSCLSAVQLGMFFFLCV